MRISFCGLQAMYKHVVPFQMACMDQLSTAEERRMNQLGTAEFEATKVRHKFSRACRSIMRRCSDIDSNAAPLKCLT